MSSFQTCPDRVAWVNTVAFPPRLWLAQTPTPLQPLARLSRLLGGPNIWVKRDDLSGCAISGNKVRKLEFTLARALAEGCDTLITAGGVQSNHCRTTAILGAQLGLKVHLILRQEGRDSAYAEGNLLLSELAGAEVSVYPKSEYQHKASAFFEQWTEHYRNRGCKPWSIPVGASDGTGVWGYIDCARELLEDFQKANIRPRAIVHATGSGGTQAGLSAGAALYGLDCPVIGMAVCDSERYFLKKVRADLQHWQSLYSHEIDVNKLALNVNDQYIGPGYAQASPEVFDTIRLVARTEGLILDPVYTGKGFHGLVEEIRKGYFRSGDDVVFIHTGGIFGLMAQADSLAASVTGAY